MDIGMKANYQACVVGLESALKKYERHVNPPFREYKDQIKWKSLGSFFNFDEADYDDEKFTLSRVDDVLADIEEDSVISKYASFYIQSRKKELVDFVNQDGAISIARDLNRYKIPVPPQGIQEEFIRFYENKEEKIKQKKARIAILYAEIAELDT